MFPSSLINIFFSGKSVALSTLKSVMTNPLQGGVHFVSSKPILSRLEVRFPLESNRPKIIYQFDFILFSLRLEEQCDTSVVSEPVKVCTPGEAHQVVMIIMIIIGEVRSVTCIEKASLFFKLYNHLWSRP